jgi:hypothetical protein
MPDPKATCRLACRVLSNVLGPETPGVAIGGGNEPARPIQGADDVTAQLDVLHGDALQRLDGEIIAQAAEGGVGIGDDIRGEQISVNSRDHTPLRRKHVQPCDLSQRRYRLCERFPVMSRHFTKGQETSQTVD